MNKTIIGVASLIAAFAADAAKIENDTRIEFEATLPDKANLTISLGRGKERLEISSRGNAYPWSFAGTDGSDPRRRAYPGSSRPEEKASYWWERSEYTPNGRYKRSFATAQWVADLSEAMQGERWQTADNRVLKLAVELSGGWLSFWVDDILLHALPATGDIAGREVLVKSSKGAKLSGQRVVAAPAEKGVWKVRGTANVDVSRSWTREATVAEYGEPNNGTFGGRWAGALSATPCRLQYRVPNRRWGEMRFTATCDDPKRNFLTVQFYRPGSGFPVDFVPAEPIPADGKPHLVRVPLRQDLLAAFADREIIEFELTGNVENYRAHPEPSHYSRHGVGLPSAVKVSNVELVEAPVVIDFEPEEFGSLWTGLGVKPAYVLTLRCGAGMEPPAVSSAEKVKIVLSSTSRDGKDTTRQEREAALRVGEDARIRLEIPVKTFGWHGLALEVNGEKYERSFVVMRPRETKARRADVPGFRFGSWPPGGLHFGLPVYDYCRIAFRLGTEGFAFTGICRRSDIEPLAKRYGAKTYNVADCASTDKKGYCDPDLEGLLRKTATPETAVSEPLWQNLFAEPGGIGQLASIAALCGEKTTARSEAEQERFMFFKTNIIHFSDTYRRVFPGKKLMMPWGSPLFTVAYLQDPETRDKFDGMSFDSAFFDRMPEGQLHACSLYLLSLLQREWKKYRDDKPFLASVEGPCVSRTAKEVLTPDEQLRNNIRSCLMLTANGVTYLMSNIGAGPESASYWGEQHYSGGAYSRITMNPHPVLAAFATMIRMLRDCEFVRSVPTGSLGTFCLEYRNAKTGEPLHAMWCLRGKVPVKGKCRVVFDVMDNAIALRELTPDPVFALGVKGRLEFGKQTFGREETEPASDAKKICSLSGWTQVEGGFDTEYLDSMPACIVRHPAKMTVESKDGRLSVSLPEGLSDLGPMPFTTAIAPPAPIVLPGRPRVIAIDTDVSKADWGRIVYVLRDSKGEKFISVGLKNTYNVDDTRCDSFFNFDGRRLVRFELPGNRPWDKSRYPGSCWWGAYGGDDVVDYPLSLEKIYVERRKKAMHANEEVAAPIAPVTFGDLYVEGVEPEIALEMPRAEGVKMQNPIAEINGTLEPSEITEVKHPLHYYDGTRGHFAFREMEGAVSYDIYVSPSASGEGAILLKKGAKKSGELVTGFVAGRDLYGFVVWRDAKGVLSRPSAPFKFRLKDEFAEK